MRSPATAPGLARVNFATSKTNEDEDALGGQEHTGAQLRVAASGPGAANVTGQIDQTDLFFLVNNALGIDGIDHKLTFENKMQQDDSQAERSSTSSLIGGLGLAVLLTLAGVLGLISVIVLAFPLAVDSILRPLAKPK